MKVSNESLAQLVTASENVASGLRSLSDGITSLNSSLSYSTLNYTIWSNLSEKTGAVVTEANKNSLEAALTSSDITALIGGLPDGDAKMALTNYVSAAQNYVSINQAYAAGLNTYLSAIQGSVDSKSGSAYLAAQAKVLSDNYAVFHTNIEELNTTLSTLADSMTTLKNAISTLVTQYATLDEGLNSYVDGVAAVLSGYQELEQGIQTLSSGVSKLKDGSSQLYDGTKDLKDGAGALADGTEEFKDKTSDIDQVIEDKIDSMIGEVTGVCPLFYKEVFSCRNRSFSFLKQRNIFDQCFNRNPCISHAFDKTNPVTVLFGIVTNSTLIPAYRRK